MTDSPTDELGTLVQAYARASWGNAPDMQATEDLASRLDPTLRDRIDGLGNDARRLLVVAPGQVLNEIDRLERAAMLEDAGVGPNGGRVRRDEEARAGEGSQTSGRGGDRTRTKQRGASSGQRRGRQRS